jgi:hypothetical protein
MVENCGSDDGVDDINMHVEDNNAIPAATNQRKLLSDTHTKSPSVLFLRVLSQALLLQAIHLFNNIVS